MDNLKHELAWLKLDVAVIGNQNKPPFFIGSMLRGALGYALKDTVCINPSFKCEGCFAAKECVYHQFYETENVSHAFRLGLTLQAESFDFSLYLFEEACSALPFILSAIQRTIELQGLGKDKAKMKLANLTIDKQVVYDGKSFLSLENIEPNKVKLDSFCPNISLQFTMPLRIKENNKIAKESVALHTIVNNIHSRYRQLKKRSPQKLGHRVEGEIRSSTLKYVEMKRYSGRQKQSIYIGGLKGTLRLKGIDVESYKLLKIGEIIAAGKQTAFGLGSYKMIEDI